MIILGIESSCDETAVAVCRSGREILSDVVLSQVENHAVYGGVVPEIASRLHIESIYDLAERAVKNAGIDKSEIDAVAATNEPGLIGALLVGLNFGKAAAMALCRPFIAVNHIRAHISACYLAFAELEPPFCCLMASGGNTLILRVDGYTDIHVLGGTRDDAAGEAFDKVARVLGAGYPGGREIDRLAKTGDPDAYSMPKPAVSGAPFDCSFSGLKTYVINTVHTARQKGIEINANDMAASFSKTVAEMLCSRIIDAELISKTGKIAVCGGVAANSVLRETIKKEASRIGARFYIPPVSLCGDNGAMIAAQGYYEYNNRGVSPFDTNAYASSDMRVKL